MPRTLSAGLLLSLARSAHACVTCDSATACQVRHGIFGTHFASTLLLTAAPVPFFLFRFPLPSPQADC